MNAVEKLGMIMIVLAATMMAAMFVIGRGDVAAAVYPSGEHMPFWQTFFVFAVGMVLFLFGDKHNAG